MALRDLQGIAADAGEYGSIVVESDAPPGQVLSGIQAVSTSHGRLLSLPLPWKDRDTRANGGQHPWRADRGYSSTVLLFNPDRERSNGIQLLIYADGVRWKKAVPVPPLATVPVRINDIIAGQEPDDEGRTLPPGSAAGLAAWATAVAPRVFGMLVQTQEAMGVLRPFACEIQVGLCALTVPDLNLEAGQQGNAAAAYLGCLGGGCGVCNDDCGDWQWSASSYNWTTGNSSIASITSGATSAQAVVQGNAVGNTYVQLEASDVNACAATGQGQVTVIVPVALSMDITSYTINKQADTQDVVATVSAPAGALTATGTNITVSASVANPSGVQFSQNPASSQCSLTLNTGQTSQNCTLTLTTSQTNTNSGTLTITFTAAQSGGQSATISGSPKTATVTTIP